MPLLIDWHAHHTAPELAARLGDLGGRPPRPDPYDSPDFSVRIGEMDAAGVDLQLVSQGAGLNADRLPPEQALEMVRASNDLVAERIAPYSDRLFGTIAFTWQDVPGSVTEIRRMAGAGFRAVLMYARPDLIGAPEVEPIFAAIDELGLPIFLHGGGAGSRQSEGLERLEDAGQGVQVSALADAAVSETVVRMIAAGIFDPPGRQGREQRQASATPASPSAGPPTLSLSSSLGHPNGTSTLLAAPSRLQIVIRSAGGSVPLLLSKLWWKHKGPNGEQPYSQVLLEHFLVDCASANARTVAFLIDTMGEDRVVFGSDYCGGLGPLGKALPAIEQQPDPTRVKALTERNSRRLLRI